MTLWTTERVGKSYKGVENAFTDYICGYLLLKSTIGKVTPESFKC